MVYNSHRRFDIKLRQIIATGFLLVTSFVAQAQMGWNSCFFKIFIEKNKVLLLKDTSTYTLYNKHIDFKEIKYKGTWLCPDSCWSLHSDGSSYTGNRQEEDVVFHPFLFIINEVTRDTMQVHFNYVVHGFENGTQNPIVNEIVFIPGQFVIYERVKKKDWINYTTSNKIKKQQ